MRYPRRRPPDQSGFLNRGLRRLQMAGVGFDFPALAKQISQCLLGVNFRIDQRRDERDLFRAKTFLINRVAQFANQDRIGQRRELLRAHPSRPVGTGGFQPLDELVGRSQRAQPA